MSKRNVDNAFESIKTNLILEDIIELVSMLSQYLEEVSQEDMKETL